MDLIPRTDSEASDTACLRSILPTLVRFSENFNYLEHSHINYSTSGQHNHQHPLPGTTANPGLHVLMAHNVKDLMHPQRPTMIRIKSLTPTLPFLR